MQETFMVEDVLNALIQLETVGNLNYTKLATLTENPSASALFSKLADQELGHKKIYEGILKESGKAEPKDADYQDYIQLLLKHHIEFLRRSSEAQTYSQAMDIALQLEKDTLFFLHEIQSLIGIDHKAIFETLKAEERKHLAYLIQHMTKG